MPVGNVHISASVVYYEFNAAWIFEQFNLAQLIYRLSAIVCRGSGVKIVRPRPKGAAEAEKDLFKSTRLRRPLQARLI